MMKNTAKESPQPIKGAEIVIKTLEHLGVETIFAYPGGPYAENAVPILKKKGFLAARTTEQRAFDAMTDDPMRLPAIPIQGDDPALFRNAVSRATETEAVVLVFHGVPEYVHPWVHTDFERFKEYMAYLKENDFRVLSLRDALRG